MIHPVSTTIAQRPRHEVSSIIQSPQINQISPTPGRSQDEEVNLDNSHLNNHSMMPLALGADDSRIPEALVESVMNTSKLEPRLEYQRNDIVINLRNVALLWAAFSANSVLIVYYSITVYPFVALVLLSEYTTASRIRNVITQR